MSAPGQLVVLPVNLPELDCEVIKESKLRFVLARNFGQLTPIYPAPGPDNFIFGEIEDYIIYTDDLTAKAIEGGIVGKPEFGGGDLELQEGVGGLYGLSGDCPYSSRDVRANLSAKETAQAIEKLECMNTNWANFVLCSSYINEKDYEAAQFYLDRVIVITDEEQRLYEFYAAKIAEMTGGLGKAENGSFPLEFVLEEWLVEEETSERRILSESELAATTGAKYRRYTARLAKSSLLHSSKDSQLLCYPNPNNGSFKLNLSF